MWNVALAMTVLLVVSLMLIVGAKDSPKWSARIGKKKLIFIGRANLFLITTVIAGMLIVLEYNCIAYSIGCRAAGVL